MDTNSGGIAEKWDHFYWESVKRAHKLKILKYPLLCLLTLLFGIAFVVQFCVNGIILLGHKIRSAFSHWKSVKFTPHKKVKEPSEDLELAEPSEPPEETDPSENQISMRRYRYVAILAAVLLLAASSIFFLQKNIPSTVCLPTNSSNKNGTAASETTNSSQSTASIPAKLSLDISKPTLGADGNYQFSVTVKADETAANSSGSLQVPDANHSSFQLSGLKPGTNTITVSKKDLGDLLPSSAPKSVIIVDTTSYVMAPNDVYGIRAQLIGKSKDALTAHSSDIQVAGVIQYSNTYFQVVAHKEGSCEIVFEANGMRTSTKITVQADAQAHGDPGRVLAAK